MDYVEIFANIKILFEKSSSFYYFDIILGRFLFRKMQTKGFLCLLVSLRGGVQTMAISGLARNVPAVICTSFL